MSPRAVFLDRDGTLAEERGPVAVWEDGWLYPYAAQSLLRLQSMGFLLFIVTNQGAVAKGLVTVAQVDRVHRRLLAALSASGVNIAAIRYCPHHPEGTVAPYRQTCPDRKPGDGMVRHLARTFDVDLGRSWMVGDHATDIMAGLSAGTHACLVGTGHGRAWWDWAERMPSVYRASTLADLPTLIAQKKLAAPPRIWEEMARRRRMSGMQWGLNDESGR